MFRWGLSWLAHSISISDGFLDFVTVPSLCHFHLTVNKKESVALLAAPTHPAPIEKKNALNVYEVISSLKTDSLPKTV